MTKCKKKNFDSLSKKIDIFFGTKKKSVFPFLCLFLARVCFFFLNIFFIILLMIYWWNSLRSAGDTLEVTPHTAHSEVRRRVLGRLHTRRNCLLWLYETVPYWRPKKLKIFPRFVEIFFVFLFFRSIFELKKIKWICIFIGNCLRITNFAFFFKI